MLKAIRMTALSAIVGLSALAAPAAANAATIQFGFGPQGAGVRVYHGDNGHVVRRGHHRDHFRRAPRRVVSCTPQQAVYKAERMGVHRAHVRRVTRNVIKVNGRRFGRHVNVVFARAPHCPVIR